MEPTLDSLPLREAGSDLLVREPGSPQGGLGRLLGMLMLRTRGVPGSSQLAVRQTTTRIGRGAAAQIMLSHPSVSEDHAELRLRGGVWSLTDLGSTNGSWVDGEAVHTSLPVAPGSEIRLGEVVLAFNAHDRWEDSADERAEQAPLIDGASIELPPTDARPGPAAAAASPAPRRHSGKIVFGGLDYRDPPPARSRTKVALIAVGVVAIALLVYLLLQVR